MKVAALLMDTRSIQKYIFSGTTLRTNIGASYIVEQLFQNDLVKKVLKGDIGSELGLILPNEETWESPKGNDEIEKGFTNQAYNTYVAYIGGGNALVLFDETVMTATDDPRKAVVRAFTKHILVEYPGLKTNAALGTLELDDTEIIVDKETNVILGTLESSDTKNTVGTEITTVFQKGLKDLYAVLKKHQNEIHPIVNVPMTGFTLPCSINGESANGEWNEPAKGEADENANGELDEHDLNRKRVGRYISQEVIAKNKMAEQSTEHLHSVYGEYISGYTFPKKFEDLGQVTGDDYFAIVHIDGNNMGERFQKCKSLAERSALSKQVKSITERAFAVIVQVAASISEEKYLEENIKVCRKDEDNDKDKDSVQYLPIRPIIIGGDDVTFVCHARMATILSHVFMNALERISREEMAHLDTLGDSAMYSCGGIAILNTSYPFFRGYELAEQLCANAKKESRANGSSWIDFAILHGEQSPTLEQIREQEYTSELGGQLHFGPYIVSQKMVVGNTDKQVVVVEEEKPEKRYTAMLETIRLFRESMKKDDEGMGHNKVKGLRHALQADLHTLNDTIEQLKYRKTPLPKTEGWDDYHKYGWKEEYIHATRKEGANFVTPYIDAIEILEYVPQESTQKKVYEEMEVALNYVNEIYSNK